MDLTMFILALALWDNVPAPPSLSPPSLSPEDLEVVRNLDLLQDLEFAHSLEMFAGPEGEDTSPTDDDLPDEVSP